MNVRLYESIIDVVYILAALMIVVLSIFVLVCVVHSGWRSFNRVMDHLTYGRWME